MLNSTENHPDTLKARNADTFTVLFSCIKNHPDTLKALEGHPDENGQTLLHCVAKSVGVKIVPAFLNDIKNHPDTIKALVLKPDRDGQPALDCAAERGYQSVIEILRGEYNRIASMLDSDDSDDFLNEQLETLKKYVNNEYYTKDNKEEILGKLEEILSEKSQNVELGGSSSSDTVEDPEVLRLREGSSIEE